MADHLAETVHRHKRGEPGRPEPVGMYSVCSAHPTVLTAAMRQASADGTPLLVEATSNQVDQFGGYTGMTPVAFRDLVAGIADAEGFPPDRLVLGGDHLGPNRWQDGDAAVAMDRAEDLVVAYVAAGYTKIHLDCSMPLAGDVRPLDDDLVAGRAARLLRAAEDAAVGPSPVSYVIGTEVPVPGGAHETLSELTPTPPDAARATLAAHRRAFAAVGLDAVWPRVVALVVQPGVEFDHLRVIDYDDSRTGDLRSVLDGEPGMVFEAHSTDYQTPDRLARLVDDHWAILKVGPGLTFALREALFALAMIEDQLVPAGARSELIETVDARMRAEPAQWQRYYEGSEAEQRIARRFSYSDRLRYYWPDPIIREAEATLYRNLESSGVPWPLISQYLPVQYGRVRDGELSAAPRELVIDRVRDALRPYASAVDARGRRRTRPDAPSRTRADAPSGTA